MAIDLAHWKMILESGAKGRALSAGYPDLLLVAEDIPSAQDFPIRRDTELVQGHHGWKTPIADSAAVFRAIGLELDVIDRTVLHGCERVVDLNEDWDHEAAAPYTEQYDLVIDPGTSEHCFNIARALQNLASAVKVGGVMSQALPISMFNHGYWNVNPVALVDFYELNGFRIERLLIRHKTDIFEPPITDRSRRMKGVPEDAVTVLTARRLEKKPFAWPQQK